MEREPPRLPAVAGKVIRLVAAAGRIMERRRHGEARLLKESGRDNHATLRDGPLARRRRPFQAVRLYQATLMGAEWAQDADNGGPRFPPTEGSWDCAAVS